MKLTGVEVSLETLVNPEANMILVVVLDQNGAKKLIKVDRQSIPDGELVVSLTTAPDDSKAQLQSGCWVFSDGQWVWKDPCPY